MRAVIAWALYWLGDAVSRLLHLVPDRDGRAWELLGELLYRPYNRLMVWSVTIQGDGPGPWGKPA